MIVKKKYCEMIFKKSRESCNQKRKIVLPIIIGYAAFYIIRLNFSFSIPSLIDAFGYTKTQIGTAFTFFSLIYGVGKFFSGIIADLKNAKVLLILGLVGSALINFLLPSSVSIWNLTLLLGINGCFQSMGWPACVKILNYWFEKKKMGTVWGLCNSSHALGSAAIALSAAYLMEHYSWRGLFYIPGILSILVAILIAVSLPYPGNFQIHSFEKLKFKLYVSEVFSEVFKNKCVWYMCLGTLCLYVVRISFLNWLPTFLVETKGSALSTAGMQFSGFELLGILGGMCAGVLADKWGGKYRSLIAMVFLFGLLFCIFFIVYIPLHKEFLFNIALSFSGFFVYGPQILGGLIANDCVPKGKTSATTGLVGAFGYLGATFSGAGIGNFVDSYGWNFVFYILFSSTALSFVFFYLASLIIKKNNTSSA